MSEQEILLVGNGGYGFDPVLLVHVAVGTGLPFLVGLVTTKLTPGWIKGSLLVALTVASNVGAELAQALVLHTDFALVDVTVLSALQLAYSVGLHKAVIAPGPLADWLATHLKKADPRQVELIEQGWVGPLPKTEKELDYAVDPFAAARKYDEQEETGYRTISVEEANRKNEEIKLASGKAQAAALTENLIKAGVLPDKNGYFVGPFDAEYPDGTPVAADHPMLNTDRTPAASWPDDVPKPVLTEEDQVEILAEVEEKRAEVLEKGWGDATPWSDPNHDVMADLRAHKDAIVNAPQREHVTIRLADGTYDIDWVTLEEKKKLQFVEQHPELGTVYSRPRKFQTDGWADMVGMKVPEGAERDTDGTWVYGNARYMTHEQHEQQIRAGIANGPQKPFTRRDLRARQEQDQTPVADDYKSKHRAGDSE